MNINIKESVYMFELVIYISTKKNPKKTVLQPDHGSKQLFHAN